MKSFKGKLIGEGASVNTVQCIPAVRLTGLFSKNVPQKRGRPYIRSLFTDSMRDSSHQNFPLLD